MAISRQQPVEHAAQSFLRRETVGRSHVAGVPVRRTPDSCSLHRTLFEGFSRADDKIGDKADRGSRAGILRFVRFFHSSFEPLDDTAVRRRIGFVLVVSSDVPYA